MPRESSFQAYRQTTLPASINGPFARLLTSTLGAIQDTELDITEAAAKCRIPRYCPDDGLDALGRTFQLERYPGETNTSYRARLEKAWTTWNEAGAATSIERQLVAAFGCDVRVYQIYEADFGPDPLAAYSEFFVVIGPGLGTFTPTHAQVVMAKRIVLKWKAIHGYPVKIIVLSGTGPILGWGVLGGVMPLSLGAFMLGGATSTTYPIGRTLGDTMPTLGSSLCILGGYDLT